MQETSNKEVRERGGIQEEAVKGNLQKNTTITKLTIAASSITSNPMHSPLCLNQNQFEETKE